MSRKFRTRKKKLNKFIKYLPVKQNKRIKNKGVIKSPREIYLSEEDRITYTYEVVDWLTWAVEITKDNYLSYKKDS